MLKQEVYSLLLWVNESNTKLIVERYLSSNFKILQQVKICWQPKYLEQNLISFYSYSQRHLNPAAFQEFIQHQMEYCSFRDMIFYVFEDSKPDYRLIETSVGHKSLNFNIQKIQIELQESFSSKFNLHIAQDLFESNRDSTVLLGKNICDVLQTPENLDSNVIHSNCLGVNGFKSIEQFFYLLNNCIKYVVLRNFECLPEKYFLKDHDDIDLLVEDIKYMIYLTHAKSVFPEDKSRVHYRILIKKEWVPFDLRFVGDNYYDVNWQKSILENSSIFNSMIRVPNQLHYFHSLLYHAYVQKKKIKSDYFPKLQSLGKNIGIEFRPEMTFQEIKMVLDDFLEINNYQYTIPKDPSVHFSYTYALNPEKIEAFHCKLSSSTIRIDKNVYFSEVFVDKELEKIYKFCSWYIGQNEERYLRRLETTNITPTLIGVLEKENYCLLEMEYIKGYPLSQLNSLSSFWRFSNIDILLKKAVDILISLKKNEIQHRDIRMENLIWENQTHELKIIDFGWSKDLYVDAVITPVELNKRNRKASNNFCDINAMSKTIIEVYAGFPSIQRYIQSTMNFLLEDSSVENMQNVKQEINFSGGLTFSENFKWYLKKTPYVDFKLHQFYYRYILNKL